MLQWDNRRVDYVKCSANLEYDRAMDLGNQWYLTFGMEEWGTGAPKNAHVKSVRMNQDLTRLYVFEAWGDMAAKADGLNWDLWSPMLERIDVREEAVVTDEGIDALHDAIRRANRGNRNVTLYDSRNRSKRGGRAAGGRGLAVGSHKSDFRASVYKRGSESGAVEYQLAGKLLHGKIALVRSMIKSGYQAYADNPWKALADSIWAYGSVKLWETANINGADLGGLLAGDTAKEEKEEERLERLERSVNLLSRDGKMSLLTAIQMDLSLDI